MARISAFYLILLLAAAGCGGGGGGGSNESGPPPAPSVSGGRIIFFGDSLTSGYRLPATQAYPALIQRKLDDAGMGYQSENFGVNGDTSSDGLERLGEALGSPVAVFVLALGVNDAEDGASASAAEANLQEILTRVTLSSPAARLVVAGMDLPAIMTHEQSEEYGRMYQRLAARNGAALIPNLLAGVAGEPEMNDGIHPNAEGHRLIAETVWTALLPIISVR